MLGEIIFQTPSLINDIVGCICSYGTSICVTDEINHTPEPFDQ